jgi:predicted nucleotidyltransferase
MQSTYDRVRYYKIGEKRKNRIITKLKKLLDGNEQVKFAWLFGSLTRRDSVRDIDVAIQAEPELAFGEFLDLGAQIELELGFPVELVEIGKVPDSLRVNILKNGIPIKVSKLRLHQF